jgi:hypothetical protein
MTWQNHGQFCMQLGPFSVDSIENISDRAKESQSADPIDFPMLKIAG